MNKNNPELILCKIFRYIDNGFYNFMNNYKINNFKLSINKLIIYKLIW